jgi:hypothetical protein
MLNVIMLNLIISGAFLLNAVILIVTAPQSADI